MAFRRGGRYYIEMSVAGVGRLPRLSTYQRNKTVASDMESMLRHLVNMGFRDLVIAVRDRKLELPALWAAYRMQNCEDALRGLLGAVGTPNVVPIANGVTATQASTLTGAGNGLATQSLYDAVKKRQAATTDDRVKSGFDQLLRYAAEAELRVADEQGREPLVRVGTEITVASTDDEIRSAVAGLSLSWLAESEHITALYRIAVEAGRAPNTVRRGLHRAVSELLQHRIKRGPALLIMKDVKVPNENDERHVMLEVEEIEHALDLADDEFRPVLGLALTTGVDRAPIIRAKVRDYNEELGLMSVHDTKEADRPRTLLLRGTYVLENSQHWLNEMARGKSAQDSLTTLTADMIRDRWEALRVKLGRPEVRWKDLRGVFATHFLRAGGNPRDLQHILGHADMKMSMRYVRRMPAGAGTSEAWEEIRRKSRLAGLPRNVVQAAQQLTKNI